MKHSVAWIAELEAKCWLIADRSWHWFGSALVTTAFMGVDTVSADEK